MKSKPYIAAQEYVTIVPLAMQNICDLARKVISTVVFLFTFKEMSGHFLYKTYDRVLFIVSQSHHNFTIRKLLLFGEYISS